MRYELNSSWNYSYYLDTPIATCGQEESHVAVWVGQVVSAWMWAEPKSEASMNPEPDTNCASHIEHVHGVRYEIKTSTLSS